MSSKSILSAVSLGALSLGLGAGAVHAEEAVNPLNTVVVTATRTEQPLALTGSSVSVATAEDIRVSQKVVLTDLLRELPGVTVTRTGGPGSITNMFIRGIGGDQTVVLIDGVRINDPSAPNGATNLQNLVTTGVERVEVLRGPQSTLFGSHAMGGVVNIITRSGQPGFHADGLVEGGSFDSWRAAGTVSGGSERVQASLSGSFYDTDGISAADKSNGNAEKDGFRNWSVLGSIGATIVDGVRLDVKSLYNRSRNEFDNYLSIPPFSLVDTQDYSRTELYSSYAGLTVDPLDGKFVNRVAAGYSRTDRKDFDPSQADPVSFDARGEARRFEYQGIVRPLENTELTFGAETERTKIRSQSRYDAVPLKADVDIHSLYAQGQTTLFDRLTLIAGVRYDDHDTFGDRTTFRVAGSYRVESTDTLLHANWAEGFKAPTLYQLYSFYGNEGLEAETSEGWEVGVNQGLVDGKIRLSATYFEQSVDNQIDFAFCTPGDPLCASGRFGYYDNIARASYRGVELGVLLQPIDALSLEASYTYVRPKNEETDTDLARRARDSVKVKANWQPVERLNLSTSLTHTGKSYSSNGEFEPLKAYTLVDVRAAFEVTKTIEVFGRVENLFDVDYQVVKDYGTLGRGAFIGVRARY